MPDIQAKIKKLKEFIENEGLVKKDQQKIFEKFYQVDSSSTRQTGGAGLGLAIVKRIVEMHEGKVWAESDGLNKGSRFCFTMPVAKSL